MQRDVAARHLNNLQRAHRVRTRIRNVVTIIGVAYDGRGSDIITIIIIIIIIVCRVVKKKKTRLESFCFVHLHFLTV